MIRELAEAAAPHLGLAFGIGLAIVEVRLPVFLPRGWYKRDSKQSSPSRSAKRRWRGCGSGLLFARKEIMMYGWPLRLTIAMSATLVLPGVSAGGQAGPPVCSVSIDKQVDCGGGFIDIGDVDESCIGWNKITSTVPDTPAEIIAVRWVIENTGEDVLIDCTLTESNQKLFPQSNIGSLAPGDTSIQTFEKACSDELAMGEPDTADVRCECATDEPGAPPEDRTAFAVDSADFQCQIPVLSAPNSCVPQLDPMAELTFDYQVRVRNTGSESNGATLDNCLVSYGLEPGSCPPLLLPDPDPILFDDVETLLPGEEVTVVFRDNLLDMPTCNVATVTCDIRGSTGEDGPKQITARSGFECVPMPPLESCRSAKKQSISIRSTRTLKWKWKWKKGEATTKAEFGDPTTTTDYRVCLYYGSFGAQKRPTCSDVPHGVGWKETKKGYRFKIHGDVEGVQQIKLKEGEAGKAKIQIKKTNDRTSLPLDATVVVQISNSEGECWESLFSTFEKNNVNKFDAK